MANEERGLEPQQSSPAALHAAAREDARRHLQNACESLRVIEKTLSRDGASMYDAAACATRETVAASTVMAKACMSSTGEMIRQRPMVALAVAAVGGMLLSRMLQRPRY